MYTLPRGDTFSLAGTVATKQNNTSVTDFTGWTAVCLVLNRQERVIGSIGCSWLDEATGLLALISGGNTAEWPIGELSLRLTLITPGGHRVTAPLQKFLVAE